MFPFRNILFPTDFTPHARAALKYAAAFARSGGGRVVLFSVQSAQVPMNLLTVPERVLEEPDRMFGCGSCAARLETYLRILSLRAWKSSL